MTSNLPQIRTKYGEQIGIELFFALPDLTDEAKSFFDADSVAAVSSITANGTDFVANQYVFLGQIGSERTEIVQIATASATTITLVSPSVYAHNRGDIIRFVPFNQLVPERSTDAGSTFSALSTINVRADASETYLQRPTDSATDYYRFRFFNSTSGNYSAYSSSVSASGYGDGTVWSVKNRALDQLGEKIDNLITDQFLNDSLMEARRVADFNPAILRWSFRTKFGVIIGQMLSGQWQIAAPIDLRDRNSFKNILSLRMGNQNRPIIYQDRRRFNQNYLNVVKTTTALPVLTSAVSIVLSSTHDLDATGSLTISNEAVGNGLIAIAYTGNNKTTNTLTGVTGVTRNIGSGVTVWQRPTFGIPTSYTIDNAVLSFDVPLSITYDGQDLKGDYYKAIPVISNDSDTFDEPFYDLYVPYLKYKIKYKKANGKIDRDSDPDFKDWITGLSELIGQEVPGQMVQFVPDVDGFLSASE